MAGRRLDNSAAIAAISIQKQLSSKIEKMRPRAIVTSVAGAKAAMMHAILPNTACALSHGGMWQLDGYYFN
jgi:hypothetical protein